MPAPGGGIPPGGGGGGTPPSDGRGSPGCGRLGIGVGTGGVVVGVPPRRPAMRRPASNAIGSGVGAALGCRDGTATGG